MKRIVIDLSNLAYICLYGYQSRNGKDKYDKDDFLKICNSKIYAIKAETKAKEIAFAKDNYPKRKELDEDYKANRSRCQFPIKKDLEKFLLKNHFKIYEAKDKEADDVMATLLKQKKVDCIVTTDRDLLQAAATGKNVFNPITHEFWDSKKLEKHFQVKKFQDVLWYKAFFGDSSDNIPKAGMRLPRKDICKVIRAHKFHNWKQLRSQLKKLACYEKIDFERVKLNYRLVKLDSNCNITIVKNRKKK